MKNYVCEQLLGEVSERLEDELKRRGRKAGGRKIEMCPLCMRIATGHQIKVWSLYVKDPGKDWNIIGGASPGLYDKISYCSALGPSYDLAYQTLSKFGVETTLSSVRDVTNHLGKLN